MSGITEFWDHGIAGLRIWGAPCNSQICELLLMIWGCVSCPPEIKNGCNYAKRPENCEQDCGIRILVCSSSSECLGVPVCEWGIPVLLPFSPRHPVLALDLACLGEPKKLPGATLGLLGVIPRPCSGKMLSSPPGGDAIGEVPKSVW